jgi:hypothetical protein
MAKSNSKAYWESIKAGSLYKVGGGATVLLVKVAKRRVRQPVGMCADDWFRNVTVMWPETGELETLEYYDDLDMHDDTLPLTPM